MAEHNYPHLDDTGFPYLSNVNVWQYENVFDYKRWKPDSKLKLMRVPWCGDYDNVVHFGTWEKRNEWFDNQEGSSTLLLNEFRIQPDNTVKLPIPFDVASRFNYIQVEFPPATSSNQKLDYVGNHSRDRFFYFVDNVEAVAGGTTKMLLHLDYWTTYIYDFQFDYVMLERGHAPMAETSVNDYLKNPIDNCEYLTEPDVSFGDIRIVKNTSVEQFNFGDMYLVFLTYANPKMDWGDINTDPRTPGIDMNRTQSHIGVCQAYAIDATDEEVYSFFDDVAAQAPQFFSTVQGVCFIQKSLVHDAPTDGQVKFCGHTMHNLTGYGETVNVCTLSKSSFGFDSKYVNIAKLYTYPYSVLVINDEDGNEFEIHVEDTDGKIDINRSVSLVYPYIKVEASVISAGGKRGSLQFTNMSDWGYHFGGNWWRQYLSWDVPVFAISQPASSRYKWKEFYDRKQAAVSYTNSYNSSSATANTGYDNAVRSATAERTSTRNNATLVETNADNDALYTNVARQSDLYTGQMGSMLPYYQGAREQINQSNYTSGMIETSNTIADTSVEASAAENFINGSVSSALSGAAVGGVAGAVAGAAIGVISAGVSYAFDSQLNDLNKGFEWEKAAVSLYGTAASMSSSINTNTLINDYTQRKIDRLADETTSYNDRNAANRASVMRGSANRSYNAATTNADATRDTSVANAGRTRNTSQNAVDNTLDEHKLESPFINGMTQNGQTSATRPMAMFVNVMTQDKGAIASAGDLFLRYGYALNRQWTIKDFNVMRHFTYWKCTEIWCNQEGDAIEDAQNTIKKILGDGTTVWRKPEEIGAVSIYDNIP